MNLSKTQVNLNGKWSEVPSIVFRERTVIVKGKWIRNASIHQEDWMEAEPVENPEIFVRELVDSKLLADIFSFSVRLPETKPKYSFHFEWDNLAVIPVSTYQEW